MNGNFSDFRFFIQPTINNCPDLINLNMVGVHIETDINSSILINPIKLEEFGITYLFELMKDLTYVLKSKLKYKDHLE
jgi:hypothetical protein